jgi:short-subunit dehydrogenase
LRIELTTFNIKVIIVKPGFVRTPMTDKNEFHMPFLMDVEKAAKIIINGIKKEKRIIQFPLATVIGSKIVKFMPDWLFDILMSKELPARKN